MDNRIPHRTSPNMAPRLLAVSLIALFAFTGCASQSQKLRQKINDVRDSRLRDVIHKNVAAVGGLETWSRLRDIQAQVIATVFTPDAGRILIEQRHTFKPGPQFLIRVESFETDGTFIDSLNHHGQVKLTTAQNSDDEFSRAASREQFAAGVKLFLESKALAGMLQLLNDDISGRYLNLQRKGGKISHKLEFIGSFIQRDTEADVVDEILVVWVNNETSLIERLWLRYQKPDQPDAFGYLAVNVGAYRTIELPDGMSVTLPHLLEFAPSDSQQHFSQRHIVHLEFKQYRLRLGKKTG